MGLSQAGSAERPSLAAASQQSRTRLPDRPRSWTTPCPSSLPPPSPPAAFAPTPSALVAVVAGSRCTVWVRLWGGRCPPSSPLGFRRKEPGEPCGGVFSSCAGRAARRRRPRFLGPAGAPVGGAEGGDSTVLKDNTRGVVSVGAAVAPSVVATAACEAAEGPRRDELWARCHRSAASSSCSIAGLSLPRTVKQEGAPSSPSSSACFWQKKARSPRNVSTSWNSSVSTRSDGTEEPPSVALSVVELGVPVVVVRSGRVAKCPVNRETVTSVSLLCVRLCEPGRARLSGLGSN